MRVFWWVMCVGIFLPLTAGAQTISCESLDKSQAYAHKKSYRYLAEGPEGWLFRSEKDMKADFSLTPQTIARFRELDQAFREKSMDLVIVMPPTRAMMHADKVPVPSRWIKSYEAEKAWNSYAESLVSLKAAGLNIVEFTKADIGKPDFYHKRDHHWTLEGAKLSAQRTAEVIKALPVTLPVHVYQTESAGDVAIDGSFEQFVQEVCGKNITDEKMAKVSTTPTEGDLFTSTDSAQIVVVGTSNCTEPGPSYANFAGYLREFLSTDVDNASIQGGGIDTPILAYLASDDFARHKHKIVVWEVASHYDFNGSEFDPVFAQATPAAKGFCEGSERAATKYDIRSGNSDLFAGLKAKSIPADETYIALKFNKPVKKDFALSLSYADGEKARIRFERSDRYPYDGIYFHTLGNKKSQVLTDVKMLTSKGFVATSVEAKICPLNLSRNIATGSRLNAVEPSAGAP